MNELIFLLYAFTVSSAALIALRLGKEYLISLVSVMGVLANLFVMKQITLFGLTATASDALAVGITLSLNLLQEFYTKAHAIKTIWVAFYCSLFFVCLSLLHLWYLPTLSDLSDAPFQLLLRPLPRILGASFATFLLVQYTDAHLYGFLKDYFQDRFFVLRNYGSLMITQILDTVLFSFLGLYKISAAYSDTAVMANIIIVSCTIKLLIIFVSVPYVRLAQRFYPVSSS